MTSVLLAISFSFANLSLVHTNVNRTSMELFNYAWKYLNPPSSIFVKMNLTARFTFAAHFKLLKKWSSFSFTNLRWSSPEHNCRHCVSPVQVQKLRGNEINSSLRFILSTLLILSTESPFAAFAVLTEKGCECFCVVVKLKILKTLDNTAYTWK